MIVQHVKFDSLTFLAICHEMAEKDWISRYFAPLATPGARNMRDDAGLLETGHSWQIATTDALVEGVHVLEGHSAASFAKKLVRVNVSDLLAKGARPIEGLLTLGWPRSRSTADLEQFADALKDECERWPIGLVGGDTVSSPVLFGSLMLVGGPCFEGAEPVWQNGAREGDVILLTGRIGGCIGLEDAAAGRKTPAAAHYYEPDLPGAESSALISRLASASTDVSDGLLADLSGLLERSGCGGAVRLEDVRLWRESQRLEEILYQCSGGDDYQIVCTASVEDAQLLMKSGIFYAIGDVTSGPGLSLNHRGERVNLPETLGFEHGR